MPLNIRDVRIAYFGVEANMAPLNREGDGPLASIGTRTGYEALFEDARTAQNGLKLPWAVGRPKASRFWRKYVTRQLQDGKEGGWPPIARNALVPLRHHIDLPVLQIHPQTHRSFAETYVWQTGIGVSWNVWIKGASLSVADLVALVARVWKGTVDTKSPADGSVTQTSMRKLYNGSLDRIRGEALGKAVTEDLQSEPMLVVTIVAGEFPNATPPDLMAERDALFAGLKGIMGEQPAKFADDTRADDETVYATPKLRVAWNTASLLAGGQMHQLACLHRNLLQSSLQAEMIAQTTVRLSWFLKNGGVPASLGDTRAMIGALGKAIIGQGGYSSPMLRAQLTRGEVTAAREALYK